MFKHVTRSSGCRSMLALVLIVPALALIYPIDKQIHKQTINKYYLSSIYHVLIHCSLMRLCSSCRRLCSSCRMINIYCIFVHRVYAHPAGACVYCIQSINQLISFIFIVRPALVCVSSIYSIIYLLSIYVCAHPAGACLFIFLLSPIYLLDVMIQTHTKKFHEKKFMKKVYQSIY